MPSSPTCHVVRAGRIDYLAAWDLQKALADEVSRGERPNILLVLEHPAVYTMGRRGTRSDIRLGDDKLLALGIPLYDVDRGGQVTYHGPGQLVAYPILDLKSWGGPIKYVRTLEQAIIATLGDFRIAGSTIDGLTGVWVQGEKIAAIGVKIGRGVSYHGLAINGNTDLSAFDHIVPCGITDRRVTSMERLLGRAVDMDLLGYSLVYHLGREMGLRMVEAEFPLMPAGVAEGVCRV